MNYSKRFDPKSVSNQQLLDELKSLSVRLGHTPSRSDMNKGNDTTKRLYLYTQRFGGLQGACELVGLAPNKGGLELEYDKQELLNEIVRLKAFLERTPTQEDLAEQGKYPPGAYKRHFGTYNKALKMLGIRHNIMSGQKAEDIKEDLIRVAKLLNRPPTAKEFEEFSQTVSWITAASKIDGYHSWNNTLKKCGLEVVYNKNLTDTELMNEILRLKELSGRVPGYYDMMQNGKYAPETYAYKYGTYVKALTHFGFDYAPQNQWHNQSYTKAKDGAQYRSRFEALIADVLFDLKGAGRITSYTYEQRVCDDRKWTCDFYVVIGDKELWLEADGMGKNRPEAYNDEHEKIKWYMESGKRFYILAYSKSSVADKLIGVVERLNNEV